MTAKHRKSSSGEKPPPAPSQDDASKKSQKSAGTGNGLSGPAPPGPRSGSCLGTLASFTFYVALIGAAGFAAFYLQQVVEEIRQTSVRHEESARQHAQLVSTMETVRQQVESLSSVVDGLESSLGITRVELEGAIIRMKKGEVETRRVDDALQKLQNNLLKDLSQGISEVKEARERDFSSLEKTVEERLAEVSQSVKSSVAEFTEAQAVAQSQLADLKARLGDMGDPTLLKQELSAIVDTVAEIRTAKQAADASVDSLREQIGAVRGELQTRNQEVASLSQEVESVRTVVQENVGSLKQSLSAAEATIQVLSDKAVTLESGAELAATAARSVEEQVSAAAARAQRRSDDLEARVRASEEGGESLSASVSEITSKVDSLSAKSSSFKEALAAQGRAAEEVKTGLEQELETLRSDVGQQVEDLRVRMEELVKPQQLDIIKNAVEGLAGKAAKLENHEKAISALQKALQETTKSLAGLAKAPGKKK